MRSIRMLVLSTLIAAAQSAPPSSTWVYFGANGKLIYKADAQGNRIPDFSNVGYRGGNVAIPNLTVVAEVGPVAGDAREEIQAAIDKVSRQTPDDHGWRGAVLVRRGRYAISDSIYLMADGVVLRGEGSGPEGTVLVATGATQRSLIVVGRGEFNPPAFSGTGASVATGGFASIADAYVPVGAADFHVTDATGLAVGEEIVVRRPSTARWIHDIAMDRIPVVKGHETVQWAPDTKNLYFDRVITALSGNVVTVNAPIVNALDQQYGGGQVTSASGDRGVSEVGVEDLRGDSDYKSEYDEKHGWILVDLVHARDAWVRKVVSVHYGYSCVYVEKASKSVTVESCSCLDPVSEITGGRRYSFCVDGQLNLVAHCYSRRGRHDFVTQALAAGPNVFFDCLAELSFADSGPHHRWSVGTLYDNVRVSGATRGGGEINLRDRGNMGTGHGWAGANQVVWNCSADAMIIQNPPTAQNWAIGCRAVSASGNGYWESQGTRVQPESLYLAQMSDRLGHPFYSENSPISR